jgi:hypothetical protein
MQQGSAPQMGVGAGDVFPAASQQQQPPQSIHVGIAVSALQLHMDPSLPDVPALPPPPLLVEPPVFAPALPPDEVAPPVPASLLVAPPVPASLPLSLPHAASPTVEDPVTTRT